MRILAISAHPDDETLGCGGTLLKHKAAGDELSWAILTQAHSPQWTAEVIGRKSDEVEQVAGAYGMRRSFKLGFPAARLDTIAQADLMEKIEQVVAEVKPETVYLVHGGDVHSDHRAVFQAVMSVLKPFRMARFGVRRIASYEVISSTEAAPPQGGHPFLPNLFEDITSHLERKLEILGMYESESQPDPLPRGLSAVRALARYRGAAIGVECAEAFMLIRERG